MSDVADRLRALSISSWCGTNNCPPDESCDVCKVRRGYADALDALAEIEGESAHWATRIARDALANAARLFPEDAA